MGGGGLVILRHKSWHVWNQDNVERVLVDEAAQREEQEELRETQFSKEAQARHDVLQNRSRARVRKQALSHGIALEQVFDKQPELLEAEVKRLQALPAPSSASAGHINLFADEENFRRQQDEKEAADKGKRKKKELGPPVIPDEVFRGADKDSRGFVPWYTTGVEENCQVDHLVENKKQATRAKKRIRGPGLCIDVKALEDPLTTMNSLLSPPKPLLLEGPPTLMLGMDQPKGPLALTDRHSKAPKHSSSKTSDHRRTSSSSSRSRSRSNSRRKRHKTSGHKENKKDKVGQKVIFVESSSSDTDSSKKKKHKKKKKSKSHKKDTRERENLLEVLRQGRLDREKEEKIKVQALLKLKR